MSYFLEAISRLFQLTFFEGAALVFPKRSSSGDSVDIANRTGERRDRGDSDFPSNSVRDLGLRVLEASYRQLLRKRATIAARILDGCDIQKFFPLPLF
ncbi:hypothetical protein ANCCAN_28978 [Ancylostoma caninum]|uniref:Uncharacterized protein n=1 Tax=Ancylostoma caninum TaxID=29170 RepID=A0A368EZQ0_ANCCA|nr:hypothetical protein ANCCAN_28978 [Ancylostoma caninum]